MPGKCHQSAPCRSSRRNAKVLRLSAAFRPQDASDRASLPWRTQRCWRALFRQSPDGRSFTLLDCPRRQKREDSALKGHQALPKAEPERSNPSRLTHPCIQPLGRIRQSKAKVRLHQTSPRLQRHVNHNIISEYG